MVARPNTDAGGRMKPEYKSMYLPGELKQMRTHGDKTHKFISSRFDGFQLECSFVHNTNSNGLSFIDNWNKVICENCLKKKPE